jgi:thiamine biosynthesis protein ThiC
MENQLIKARQGQITQALEQVAHDEGVENEKLR